MKFLSYKIIKYGINGVFATGVHYFALFLQVERIGITSLGVANGVASVFGITASFLGNRFFVFNDADENILSHAVRFILLYTALAFFNYGFMFYFGDLQQVDYKLVFLIATVIQFVLSYFGNKILVFK